MVKAELEKTLLGSNSVEIVQSVSDILLYVIEDQKYSPENYISEILETIQETKLGLLFESDLTKINEDFDEEYILAKSRFGQIMLYRCACAYVEGHRLEN